MSKVFGQALLDDMVHSQSLPMPLVKQAAKEILAVIREGLIQDGVVKVSNFGTFRLKPVSARQGINPRTGEAITIPARQRVIFTPCKALRDLIQPIYQPPVPLDSEQSSPERTLSGAAVASMAPRHTARKISDEPPPGTTKHAGEHASIALTPHHDSQPAAPSEATDKPRPALAPLPTPLQPSAQEKAQKPKSLSRVHETEEVIELYVESRQQEKAEINGEHLGPFDSPQHEKEEVNETQLKPVVEALNNGTITEFPMRDEKRNHAESVTVQKDDSPIAGDAPASSNRHYIVGTAAILLIALLSAGVLIESETDSNTAVPVTAAAVTESVPPALLTALSDDPPEILIDDGEAGEAGEATVKPTHSKASIEESVSSPTNTEIDTPVPLDKGDALDTMAGNTENSIAGNSTKDSISGIDSELPIVTPATNFYFVEQVHEVSNGESLWRLARHHYQDPLLWPHIYQANTTIENPDHLLVGSTIAIPALQGSPDQLTKADRRHIAEGYYLAYQHYKKIGREDALFALLEAKRYDSKVVEEHLSLIQLNQVEALQLAQQESMPF